MQWTEKYRPKKFEDVKSQDDPLKKIKRFIESFNLGKLSKQGKKALILHGPPGIGKTTIAYVMANETFSELFELNASDLRDKEKIKEILKPAVEQKSLTKRGKIILVDEVDGISGYYDKGGIQELLLLMESTPYPMIITANDIWGKKLSQIRKKSEIIQMEEISYKAIKDQMIQILRKENIFINNDILSEIAIKAKGDLRAAINDIQSISEIKDTVSIDERNKETNIFNALRMIFKGKPSNEMLNIFESVNITTDEIILWVEENIPNEYEKEELARAYEVLGKVDIFKGRIYKQQYWRFLVYENILLSYGISASKKTFRNQRLGFTSYKKPSRILKIWLNNQRTTKKKSIAQKYSKHTHIGLKRAMTEFLTVKQIIRSNQEIQKELKLTDDEVEYLGR